MHHANPPHEVSLYKWLSGSETDQIPSYAHHMIGVGGFVVNEKDEILVVSERFRHKPHLKLPGGETAALLWRTSQPKAISFQFHILFQAMLTQTKVWARLLSEKSSRKPASRQNFNPSLHLGEYIKLIPPVQWISITHLLISITLPLYQACSWHEFRLFGHLLHRLFETLDARNRDGH